MNSIRRSGSSPASCADWSTGAGWASPRWPTVRATARRPGAVPQRSAPRAQGRDRRPGRGDRDQSHPSDDHVGAGRACVEPLGDAPRHDHGSDPDLPGARRAREFGRPRRRGATASRPARGSATATPGITPGIAGPAGVSPTRSPQPSATEVEDSSFGSSSSSAGRVGVPGTAVSSAGLREGLRPVGARVAGAGGSSPRRPMTGAGRFCPLRRRGPWGRGVPRVLGVCRLGGSVGAAGSVGAGGPGAPVGDPARTWRRGVSGG